MAGTSHETLEGSNIEIGCDGVSLTVNGIKMVLKKDIVTSNGVIHLIDQVLMPDSGKLILSDSFIFFSESAEMTEIAPKYCDFSFLKLNRLWSWLDNLRAPTVTC